MKKYSRLWVKHKVLELEAKGAKFNYDLMGDFESQSKEEIEVDKGDDTSEPCEEDFQGEGRLVKIKRRTMSQTEVKQGEKPSPKTKKAPQVSTVVEEGET